MEVPTFNPHPLKNETKKAQLRLWQIQKMLRGPSEATICRMLNGLLPMSEEVETGLKQILDGIKQQHRLSNNHYVK